MVSRSISELESANSAMEVQNAPRCAMSSLKDVIPFHHISVGVCTVSSGLGLWGFPKCTMMAGHEQFLNVSFLGQSVEDSRYSYRLHICCWYHKNIAAWQPLCS